jgi:hypothetical protein
VSVVASIILRTSDGWTGKHLTFRMTRSTDSSPRFIKFNPRFIILRDRWMSWDRRPREHTIQLELFPHRNNQLRLGSSIVRGTVQWITIRYAVRERRLTRPSLPRMLDPVLYFSEGKKTEMAFARIGRRRTRFDLSGSNRSARRVTPPACTVLSSVVTHLKILR